MHRSHKTRILLLRPDNIGDTVLFSGALRHIRETWPNAWIELAVQSHVRELFEICPYVDRVVSTTRLFPWRRMRYSNTRGAWKMASLLQSEWLPRFWYPRYDVLLCPVSGLTEEITNAVRRVKAKKKIGFTGASLSGTVFKDKKNAPENVFTTHISLSQSDHWMPELARNAKFLKGCGIDVDDKDLGPEFWIGKEDMVWAQQAMPDRPVMGVFPGSTSKFRIWSESKWIDFLSSQDSFSRVVFFGAQQQQAAVERMKNMLAREDLEITDLTAKTDLRQLVACIGRCSALVSMETSGAHIAVASSIPTVCLIGGHHYGRYYPWGNPLIHRVVHAEMECFPCKRACEFGDYRCVAGISVKTVLEELSAALEQADS